MIRRAKVAMPQFKTKEEYDKWKAEKSKSNTDKITQEDAAQSKTDDSPLTFACLKCSSDNIQKASLLVSLETKELKATSSTFGVGASGGSLGVGMSGTSTSGTITAALANQLSRPIEPQQSTGNCLFVSWGLSLILSLPVLGFIIQGQLEPIASFPLILIAPVVAIGGPFYHYLHYIPERNMKHEEAKKQYRRDLLKWEKTFCCLRCGEIFQLG